MLINSNNIKTTKKHIEVMQAFIDGKEIEYRPKFSKKWMEVTTPTWNFLEYEYRKSISEPEYIYPIYKRLKTTPETVVKFLSLDFGIYVSTHDSSVYKPGDAALNMAPHTDSSWEDAPRRIMDIVRDSNGKIVDLVDRPLEPENVNTIELFEVMIYWDTAEDFKINGTLYSNKELKQLKHYQKTGRSFIIDEDTRQIIKVINK